MQHEGFDYTRLPDIVTHRLTVNAVPYAASEREMRDKPRYQTSTKLREWRQALEEAAAFLPYVPTYEHTPVALTLFFRVQAPLRVQAKANGQLTMWDTPTGRKHPLVGLTNTTVKLLEGIMYDSRERLVRICLLYTSPSPRDS